MLNKRKTGKSLILLVIVICVMSVAITFVAQIFNNKAKNKTQEEAFKLNVYEYCLEMQKYKDEMIAKQESNEEDFDAYGIELKHIIPNIIETDMSKFKIEDGELIYIGLDEQERKWTKEVRI